MPGQIVRSLLSENVMLLKNVLGAAFFGLALILAMYVLFNFYSLKPVWSPGVPEWITKQPFKPGENAALIWRNSVKIRGKECQTLVRRAIVGCGVYDLGSHFAPTTEQGSYSRLAILIQIPATIERDSICEYRETYTHYCGFLGNIFPIIEPWPDVPFHTAK